MQTAEYARTVIRVALRATVQVLPFEAGAHAGMSGSPRSLGWPNVVYLESATSGALIGVPDGVRRYRRPFECLPSEALGQESSAFLRNIEREGAGSN